LLFIYYIYIFILRIYLNSNFDGYTNSIYTISIGAISSKNEHPPYSEPCSAQIAVTYSSGSSKQIVSIVYRLT